MYHANAVFFMFVYVPVASANHVTQSTFSVGVGYTRVPVIHNL